MAAGPSVDPTQAAPGTGLKVVSYGFSARQAMCKVLLESMTVKIGQLLHFKMSLISHCRHVTNSWEIIMGFCYVLVSPPKMVHVNQKPPSTSELIYPQCLPAKEDGRGKQGSEGGLKGLSVSFWL